MAEENRIIETFVEPEIEQSEELQGEEIIVNDLFKDDNVIEQHIEPTKVGAIKLFDDLLAAKGLDEKFFEQLDKQTEQLNSDLKLYNEAVDKLEMEKHIEIIEED